VSTVDRPPLRGEAMTETMAVRRATLSESFGDRLYRIRTAKGLRQRDLGARIGVTQGVISHWERDDREPLAEHLFLLADALGVDVRWLWRGRTTP
jgi:ribosome-binding protein aMBF1 (putative translation factor)